MLPKGTVSARSTCTAAVCRRCRVGTFYAMEEGIALIPSADMVSDTHCPLSSKEVCQIRRDAAVLGILLSCDASLA